VDKVLKLVDRKLRCTNVSLEEGTSLSFLEEEASSSDLVIDRESRSTPKETTKKDSDLP